MDKTSANRSASRAGLRNTVRLRWRGDMGVDFPGRIEFVEKILMASLGFEAMDFFCIQMNSAARFVDVTFDSEDLFMTFWDRYKVYSMKAPVKDYAAESLWNRNFRIITVHMFNPYASDWDIEAFLGKYCDVLVSAVYQRDLLGIWNGKRQFKVLLRQDAKGFDGYRHPPANFSIGPNRGYLFYSGQPLYCRKCMSFGHTEMRCNQVRCRNCEELGHETKDCPFVKKCNICGSDEHLFRQCPQKKRSFAEVIREDQEKEPENEQQDGGEPRCGPADVSEAQEENVVVDKVISRGSGVQSELSRVPGQEEARQTVQEAEREEIEASREMLEEKVELNQETSKEEGWMDVDKKSGKRKKDSGNERKAAEQKLAKGKKAKEGEGIEHGNRFDGIQNLPDSDTELRSKPTESGTELGSELRSFLLSPASPCRSDLGLQSSDFNVEEFLDNAQLQQFNETTLALPILPAIQEEGMGSTSQA